jgi:hypothetical protein
LQNLPVGQFYHVAVDKATPYNIMGGLQDNGSWIAPSAAPGGVGNANWFALLGGDGFWVQPDPIDPQIVYAESQGGNINRVNKYTSKSVNIKPQQTAAEEKLRWNWNTPIVTGQADGRNLYTGAQYLFKSVDQGRNWTRISPDLTTNDKKKQEQENSGGLSADNTSAENHCTLFAIAESPMDANFIWTGTDDGNLQFTEDGGKNWVNVSANYAKAGIPTQTWISSIEPSRFNRNTVYATFDNHMYGDHATYVARSADKGNTWTLFKSNEFTGFAHKIKEDPVNPDLLFLGTEMGLFASVDGGANWFRFKNKVPDHALVRDIQIHPVTNDLLLATHGRGIIVVDDITPMRRLTQSIAEKDVHFFDAGKMKLTSGQFGNGGFPSTGGWLAGNPPSIPPFQYYLKERVSSGKITLDVLDAQGQLVLSLPGSNRKGVNKVYWNFRMKPPRTATGGTKMDVGGFVAPMVLPGNYTVVLKIGESAYSSPLVLYHDTADKAFTLTERKRQFETAMTLYSLHEQLATFVDTINARQKWIRSIDGKDKKTIASLKSYDADLEGIRASCLATKQKSIFADEERLRERITDVYVAVCSQEAAPSNLQLDRIALLKSELLQLQGKFQAIEDKYMQFRKKMTGIK